MRNWNQALCGYSFFRFHVPQACVVCLCFLFLICSVCLYRNGCRLVLGKSIEKRSKRNKNINYGKNRFTWRLCRRRSCRGLSCGGWCSCYNWTILKGDVVDSNVTSEVHATNTLKKHLNQKKMLRFKTYNYATVLGKKPERMVYDCVISQLRGRWSLLLQ